MSFDDELLDQYAMVPIVTGQIRELGRDLVVGEIVTMWASWPKYIQDVHLRNRGVTLMDRESARCAMAKAHEVMKAQRRLELEKKAGKLRAVAANAEKKATGLEAEYVKLADMAIDASSEAAFAEDAVERFDADPYALPPDKDDVAKVEAAESDLDLPIVDEVKDFEPEAVIEQHERDRWRALLERDSYAVLQGMAKERGLKAWKVNRSDLLDSLVESYAAEKLAKLNGEEPAEVEPDDDGDPGEPGELPDEENDDQDVPIEDADQDGDDISGD